MKAACLISGKGTRIEEFPPSMPTCTAMRPSVQLLPASLYAPFSSGPGAGDGGRANPAGRRKHYVSRGKETVNSAAPFTFLKTTVKLKVKPLFKEGGDGGWLLFAMAAAAYVPMIIKNG